MEFSDQISEWINKNEFSPKDILDKPELFDTLADYLNVRIESPKYKIMKTICKQLQDGTIEKERKESNKKSTEDTFQDLIEHKVSFSLQINDTKQPSWIRQINHEDVDRFSFQKYPFIEIIKKPEYIRPYFDFDSIETVEEYNKLHEWLNNLKNTLGEYSIGGYTGDEEISKITHLKYIPNAHHKVSLHVVFYQSSVSSSYFVDVMKSKKGEFLRDNIISFVDPNVYKLNTRQLFRHPLSDKIFSPGNSLNKKTSGSIITKTKPSDSILTISGKEHNISNQQLDILFPVKIVENKPEKENKNKPEKEIRNKTKTDSQITIDNIEYDDSLIRMTNDELLDFLNSLDIDIHFNGLLEQLGPLWHSPFDKVDLLEVVSEWYSQEEHDNPSNVEHIIDTYYSPEYTNKWFYSLLKYSKDSEWKSKGEIHIDFTRDINNQKITLDEVTFNQYTSKTLGLLLSDLRGCIGTVDGKWFIKSKKENQYYLQMISEESLKTKTKTTKPLKGNNKITLYQIIMKFSNVFRYYGYHKGKITKEGYINTFQGYAFEEIVTDDFSFIQPFLNHIKEVNCNGNEEYFQAVIKTLSQIIQNITYKVGACIINTGEQGCGKTLTFSTMASLLGIHASPNENEMDRLFGRFNSRLEDISLFVINEVGEAGERFPYAEKMKSAITESDITIERKGLDSYQTKQYANFIITTNSYCPIREQRGSRRYLYLESNNKYVGNKEYFSSLTSNMFNTDGSRNKKFMGILLHYLLVQDTKDFRLEDVVVSQNQNTEAEYNPNLERQYGGLNNIETFVVDHWKSFVEGVTLDWIETYMNGIKSRKSLGQSLLTICNIQRKQIDGIRKRLYVLKPKEQIQSLWNIIQYKSKDNDDQFQ